jgi:hypothetical protein
MVVLLLPQDLLLVLVVEAVREDLVEMVRVLRLVLVVWECLLPFRGLL